MESSDDHSSNISHRFIFQIIHEKNFTSSTTNSTEETSAELHPNVPPAKYSRQHNRNYTGTYLNKTDH